jgi:TolA-binding protein
MKKSISILSLIILILAGCTSEKQKLITTISNNEKELKNDTTGVLNYNKAIAMITLYEQYAEKYPEDTLSAIYLYKAADVSAHSHQTTHAIELYKKLIAKYPDYKNVPNAMFFIGFLYENELKDKKEATKAYREFLMAYPNNEQSDAARFLLQNINTSDEDLIKKFESMPQNTDSAIHKINS